MSEKYPFGTRSAWCTLLLLWAVTVPVFQVFGKADNTLCPLL